MQNHDIAVSDPLDTAFERALKDAFDVKPSEEQPWHSIVELKMRAIVSAERSVTAEEIRRNAYAARLHNLSKALGVDAIADGIQTRWMERGLLLGDEAAVKDGVVARLALASPERFAQILPGNPEWDLATCEVEFLAPHEQKAGIQCALSILAPSKEQERAERVEKTGLHGSYAATNWGDEHVAKEYEKWRQRRQLIELSDARGRLETLKANGRGAAWMLLCLEVGATAAFERALAAGLRLDGASQASATRFLWNCCSTNHIRARARDFERSRQYHPKAAWRARHAELAKEDLLSVWDCWAAAIEAGLPRIECEPDSRRELDHHNKASSVSSEAFAPLIQEIARDGGVLTAPNRRLWAKASAHKEWPEIFAQKAGAKNGESAMEWALRTGATQAAEWTAEEFFGAMRATNYFGNVGETLLALGRHGAKMPGRVGPSQWADGMGLIASMLDCAQDPKALAEGLMLVEADCAGAPKDQQAQKGIAHELFEKNSKNATAACAAFLEALDRHRPGEAKAILEAPDKDGATALHWAARGLDLVALQACADRGVDINAKDKKGQTILHWAARKYGQKSEPKFAPVIEWLRGQGFDWAATDDKGDTGVAALAKKGPIAALLKIIETTPESLSLKNKEGKTALDHLGGRDGMGEAVASAERAVMTQELKKASAAAAGNGQGPAEPSAAKAKRPGRRI
jgi:hypothetical protein